MLRDNLIFLPGMMCDERIFAPQVKALSATHEIIIPNLAQNSIEAMAMHVLENTPSGQLNIAGISMGGIVAMEMVRMAPGRIDRIALLDTNHHADAPDRRVLRDRQIADANAGRLHHVIVDEMKPSYLAEANRENHELLALLIDMAMTCGPKMFIAQSEALRDRQNMRSAFADFTGPALILCGAEDRLCPVARHHEMAELVAGAQLTIVENAGHISTLENPSDVNKALHDWLGKPV